MPGEISEAVLEKALDLVVPVCSRSRYGDPQQMRRRPIVRLDRANGTLHRYSAVAVCEKDLLVVGG